MKKALITLICLISFVKLISSEELITNYRFVPDQPGSISWTPAPGVYNNTIRLNLSSEEGTIFYIINSTMNNSEPVLFTRPVVLATENGTINQYNITVFLERSNGRIEVYTGRYIIDRSATYSPVSQIREDIERTQATDEQGRIVFDYKFGSVEYAVASKKREFVFPSARNFVPDRTERVVIGGVNAETAVYCVAATYRKGNDVISRFDPGIIDNRKPLPPSFGSLYWGQVYNQNYRLNIMTNPNNDPVYYWLKEWAKTEVITGPPQVDQLDKWTEYTGPILLNPQHGNEGTFGIAGFSRNSNGAVSDITGPFYFKTTDGVQGYNQIFEERQAIVRTPEILVNGTRLNSQSIRVKDRLRITFSDHSVNSTFYFKYKGESVSGESGLFPCDGDYDFRLSDIYPVEIEFFYSSGNKITTVELFSGEMILPIPVGYQGNTIITNSDRLIKFYMPEGIVRYETTVDLYRYLSVTSESGVFGGSILANGEEGQEVVYKVKFAVFNNSGIKIHESPDYEIRINKRGPTEDIVASGTDFSLIHNEKQIVTLSHTDESLTIYYRMDETDQWTRYLTPLVIYPQSSIKHSIRIFVKGVDYAGNERVNESPFVVEFDRRALFVDTALSFSGNGTEDNPYNSIERAIYFAEQKGIRSILIKSAENRIAHPLRINSDIIVQPFGDDPVKITLSTETISGRDHVWFSFGDKGYLEFRDISFQINSGNTFASLNNNKIKIYSCDFDIQGRTGFGFIKAVGSLVAMNDVKLRVRGTELAYSFIDITGGRMILRGVETDIDSKSIALFAINGSSFVKMSELKIDMVSGSDGKFARISNSNVEIADMICNLSGRFTEASFAVLESSRLSMKDADMIITGTNAFSISIIDDTQSKVDIETTLFRIENSFGITGFNSRNGEYRFDRSMLDISGVRDHIVGFRLNSTDIDINSSILRTTDSYNSIGFSMNNSRFSGTNNSVFSVNNRGNGYVFWINEAGTLNTVNSLYYFDSIDMNKSSLIFYNNPDYDRLRPVWISNIVSVGAGLLQNLYRRDAEQTLRDFNENNLYLDLDNNFDMSTRDFFMPLIDSQIFQGGVSQHNSPLPLCERDFLGNNRLIEGIGVDIGAFQKSGNYSVRNR